MYAAEQEGLFLIVAMLGKSHPSVAAIRPLLDRYETDEVYNGDDPGAEARAIREALALIRDAGTDMPNVYERLKYLDEKTVPGPQEEPQVPVEESVEVPAEDETEAQDVSYDDSNETEIDNGR